MLAGFGLGLVLSLVCNLFLYCVIDVVMFFI